MTRPFLFISRLFTKEIVIILLFFLTSCAHQPPNYNTAGSKGTLLRQQVGFDSNVCYYSNGIIVRTPGNCPSTVTSNVYQR